MISGQLGTSQLGMSQLGSLTSLMVPGAAPPSAPAISILSVSAPQNLPPQFLYWQDYQNQYQRSIDGC